MRIAVISFTPNGAKLNKQIIKGLGCSNRDSVKNEMCSLGSKGVEEYKIQNRLEEPVVEGYHLSRYTDAHLMQVNTSLKEWTRKAFETSEAIIYIGATGIAVRAIAPFICSKDVDPAIIVLDERGENIISLLSGHIGGANELAREIAKLVEGRPIISTATDLNKVFAVDEWAKRNDLFIKEVSQIKFVSSAFLNEEKVGLVTTFPIEGNIPKDISIKDMDSKDINKEKKEDIETGIVVDLSGKKNSFRHTLHLIPCIVTLGIGCKRGTSLEAIEKIVMKYLEEMAIDMEAISCIASIDLKKDEEGLLAFGEKCNKPFKFYTSEELAAVPGVFTPSEFVKSITQVDNVCERAAVLGSGNGELLLRKSSQDGVTLAIARENYKINFNR